MGGGSAASNQAKFVVSNYYLVTVQVQHPFSSLFFQMLIVIESNIDALAVRVLEP